MIGEFFDTVIVASSDERVVTMTHQNLSFGNCFEPPYTKPWSKNGGENCRPWSIFE